MSKRYAAFLYILPAAFLFFAVLVSTGAFLPAEQAVYQAVTRLISPGMTAVMRVITELGGAVPIIIICLVLILLPRTRWKLGLPAAGCVLLSVLCNQIIKYLVHRPRPTVLRLAPADGYSFPSGHSMNNAAFYIVLALLLLPLLRKARQKALTFVGLSLPPFLVGVSRIYLGVHFFGDVLCGWLLGVWIALLVCAFWRGRGERLRQRLRLPVCGK